VRVGALSLGAAAAAVASGAGCDPSRGFGRGEPPVICTPWLRSWPYARGLAAALTAPTHLERPPPEHLFRCQPLSSPHLCPAPSPPPPCSAVAEEARAREKLRQLDISFGDAPARPFRSGGAVAPVGGEDKAGAGPGAPYRGAAAPAPAPAAAPAAAGGARRGPGAPVGGRGGGGYGGGADAALDARGGAGRRRRVEDDDEEEDEEARGREAAGRFGAARSGGGGGGGRGPAAGGRR